MSKTEIISPSSIVRTSRGVRAVVQDAREAGEVVGLVPTMGALHEGHLSLVRAARNSCGLVVASLFVNPTQFGANEDFDSYPRDEARDLYLFAQNEVDIVYVPSVAEIYPDGFDVTVSVEGVTSILCGRIRPGHFDGVTTVVSKLFDHVQPQLAYFGEKDYQQLKVVERLVRHLNLDIKVIGCPTIRERDGLALSSRNSYLSTKERIRARALYETLEAVAGRLKTNQDLSTQCDWGRNALIKAGFDKVDYFEILDDVTLEPAIRCGFGLRVFAAAWLGNTRLIDNLSLK